jgi:hypothetical protein
MAANKMSRSDILMAGMEAGLSYADAEDLSYELSPECQTVAESRVRRAIEKMLG